MTLWLQRESGGLPCGACEACLDLVVLADGERAPQSFAEDPLIAAADFKLVGSGVGTGGPHRRRAEKQGLSPPLDDVVGGVFRVGASGSRAIKYMVARKESGLANMLTEARLTRAAAEGGVAPPLYGARYKVDDKYRLGLTMAYVPHTLEGLLRDPAWPLQLVSSALQKTLAAISALHQMAIVHGDMHPGNVGVWLDARGAPADVLLIDFGWAAYVDEAAKTPRTAYEGFARASKAPPTSAGGDVFETGILEWEKVRERNADNAMRARRLGPLHFTLGGRVLDATYPMKRTLGSPLPGYPSTWPAVEPPTTMAALHTLFRAPADFLSPMKYDNAKAGPYDPDWRVDAQDLDPSSRKEWMGLVDCGNLWVTALRELAQRQTPPAADSLSAASAQFVAFPPFAQWIGGYAEGRRVAEEADAQLKDLGDFFSSLSRGRASKRPKVSAAEMLESMGVMGDESLSTK